MGSFGPLIAWKAWSKWEDVTCARVKTMDKNVTKFGCNERRVYNKEFKIRISLDLKH